MPEVVWAVFCSDHIVDSRTNQITLVNIIENVNVKGDFPAMLGIPMWLVILWERSEIESTEPETFHYYLPVQQPGGGELIPSPKEHTGTIEKIRLRTMTAMLGLPVHGEGKLEVIIEVDSPEGRRIVGRVPLFVSHSAP